MAARYPINQITDALIHLSRERGFEITNLKLQKLLYYAQVWHLAFSDSPLFDEDIEAWVHGPVVPQVFRRFKNYRWNPITEPVSPPRDTSLAKYLGEVLNTYGEMSATQLERLTHREEPWKEAREGYAPDESSNQIITHDSMRAYYSKVRETVNERAG